MAEPTTSTRRPVRCSKHAFALPVSSRPRNDVTRNVTLPAHRHQTCLGRARLASESPVAGDDPVNESDPSGLAWCDFLPAGCGSLPGGRPGSPNGTNINYTPQGSETGEQYWAKLFCESPVGFEGKPFICGSQLNPNQGPIETEGLNRGRFQAQGGGVEESVSWSSHIVPTVSDGLQMLADLGQSLSASQFAARVGALAKATTYVRDVCAPSGGCPPLSKSFYSNGSAQQKGIRIDLEIFTGIAFIPDIVNPAQTAAYVTSSECGTVA
jgi:hypothetical protein